MPGGNNTRVSGNIYGVLARNVTFGLPTGNFSVTGERANLLIGLANTHNTKNRLNLTMKVMYDAQVYNKGVIQSVPRRGRLKTKDASLLSYPFCIKMFIYLGPQLHISGEPISATFVIYNAHSYLPFPSAGLGELDSGRRDIYRILGVGQ